MKKLIIVFALFTLFGCEIENIDFITPIVLTDEPSSVLTNSAVLGGEVVAEGGKDVIEYGVVWSENSSPTINDNKSVEGERLGSFSNLYSNLKSNTKYFYSAYAISEIGVGYGKVYEFTTSSEPSCDPAIDNRIDTGVNQINIDMVKNQDPTGFNDGNIEFEASSGFSTARFFLQFNEINKSLPLTGEYKTVDLFDNQSTRSNGEVKLKITDFGLGSLGGGSAPIGETVYVENKDGKITFIFCGVNVGDVYNLSGKFTYE
ncbi:hypothetical protein [Tenacibaculum sp. M341]|uniref:hypothetical protein n=1 Tax=Tenacibaculum sp. M341 TaxID=2530339 RepID=UPI0010515FBF|nr:hypothetical protein [Tenacibaculum sp. M341]TCI95010.1 hypothetical protein EYW44_01425 [Tenacibaculum sp. M341]